MSDRIKKGDIVNVFFWKEDDYLDSVEIIDFPDCPGDYFNLKSAEGTLYNVQHFKYMVKLK
jgi:hypothetical protein